MHIELSWGSERVVVDTARRIELSQPLGAELPQPSAFGIAPLRQEVFQVGGFVGDTRRGGSCNVTVFTLTPHGNGTHTESIGHIVHEQVPVTGCLAEPFLPTVVRRVTPIPASESPESYTPAPAPADRLLTRAALSASGPLNLPGNGALVVLTGTPPAASFGPETSAYFTHEALRWIVDQGVMHLLMDMPSVDRLDDQGLLSNHRLFWGLPAGGQRLSEASRPKATITEWLAPAENVPEGRYFAGIEVPPLISDAAPARIFLYPF